MSPRKTPQKELDDRGHFLSIDATDELQVIRDAHKILLRKHEEVEATKKDANKLPKKDLSEFINYTTVRQMLDDYMAPFAEQLPRMKQ